MGASVGKLFGLGLVLAGEYFVSRMHHRVKMETILS